LLAASVPTVGVTTLVSLVLVKSAVPLTTKSFRVVVPEDAVTFPVTLPVKLPATLPVMLPVKLPVTLPVRPPTKPVVAVTVVPLTVDAVEAPMGVELTEPPVITALLDAKVPLAVRVPVTVAVAVVITRRISTQFYNLCRRILCEDSFVCDVDSEFALNQVTCGRDC
jgi:hypothetical protein